MSIDFCLKKMYHERSEGLSVTKPETRLVGFAMQSN